MKLDIRKYIIFLHKHANRTCFCLCVCVGEHNHKTQQASDMKFDTRSVGGK